MFRLAQRENTGNQHSQDKASNKSHKSRKPKRHKNMQKPQKPQNPKTTPAEGQKTKKDPTAKKNKRSSQKSASSLHAQSSSRIVFESYLQEQPCLYASASLHEQSSLCISISPAGIFTNHLQWLDDPECLMSLRFVL